MTLGTKILLILLFAGIAVMILFRRKALRFLRKPTSGQNKTIIEDILKFMFHEDGRNEPVTHSILAEKFKLNDAFLRQILTVMQSESLIKEEASRILLLPQGRDYALKMIRLHRLYEKYLSEKTGFDKSEWHELAEKMEHRIDEVQANEMAIELGHPRFDPHGDPIPTASGEIVEQNGMPMSRLEEGQTGKIIHLEDEPDEVYQKILKAGIHVGAPVKILKKSPREIEFVTEGLVREMPIRVAENITVDGSDEVEDQDLVRLTSLKDGEEAIIAGISRECRGEIRKRLLDLGFVKGSRIRPALDNPLGDPRAYLIKGTLIALRDEQADKILIKRKL